LAFIPDERSVLREVQLGESTANVVRCLRALDRVGEQEHDVVVPPEVGEMLEREIDRAGHCTAATQLAKLVELSLSAGHRVTMRLRADRSLYSR
jgi:hypothetical protein